jgi:uncharacterized membrane protein
VLGPIDHYIDELMPFHIPGVGLAIAISAFTLVGYFGQGVLSKPAFDLFDDLIGRTPGLKLLYNLLKDMTQALVGDKKKFKEPVLVQFTETGLLKLGFVTQKNLDAIKVEGYVAVYFPHSYSFSGNLCLVPFDKVRPVSENNSQLMPFILSGGVSGLESL